MKLVRYGAVGKERPGMIDAQGVLRDLSDVVDDITPAQLSPASLRRLQELDPASLPAVRKPGRYGPPLTGVSKFIAIGLNYSDHAAETGMPVPREPIVFQKAVSSICGPDDDVVLPPGSLKTDWEVELGIVIGTRASHVSLDRARSHIAGYVLVNDVSEREYQLERGGTWDKGKGCDTFGPIGPWLVTGDEVPHPQDLRMWLDLNGEAMQRGSTRTMIFDCDTLVAYVSRFMTLMPGDIITTGTPPGVGMGMKPEPRFLKPGDTMALGIERLGEQRQRVRKHVAAAG